jgi:hypothetical protein
MSELLSSVAVSCSHAIVPDVQIGISARMHATSVACWTVQHGSMGAWETAAVNVDIGLPAPAGGRGCA